MKRKIQQFFSMIFRRKNLSTPKNFQSTLRRCLTVFDLTMLGVGSTLGAGIYILAGSVARDLAGPAVLISFFLAALASLFSGLCYAELASRYPRAGSAYVYSYVIIGEISAFITGWNLILEYAVGAASAARAWTSTLDSMVDFAISRFLLENFSLPFDDSHRIFSRYLDVAAFSLTLIVTLVLAVGVKESSRMNSFCTFVNVFCVGIIVLSGIPKVNFKNWRLTIDEIRSNSTNFVGGNGGFMPFSFSGVLTGAATCFYAFVGFDLVATTGEETENPRIAIPISICLVLFICCVIYCSVSTILTLIIPYNTIRVEASLPDAFERIGIPSVKFAIIVGAATGLTSSILGSLFPLPRILYSMSSDGLLFPIFSRVSPTSQTPIYSTLIGGFLASLMALFFDLLTLVEMLSIGTLIAYTKVSIGVLISRYENEKRNNLKILSKIFVIIVVIVIVCFISITFFERQTFVDKNIFSFFSIFLSLLLIFVYKEFDQQTQNRFENVEKVFVAPGVPWLPVLSIFCNVYLMLKLSFATWVRFFCWMILGLVIYLCYGIRNASISNFPGFI